MIRSQAVGIENKPSAIDARLKDLYIDKWMVLVQQQLDIQELDRVTVAKLIDRVMVSETRDKNGKRMMEVSIEYPFMIVWKKRQVG